MMVIPAGSQEGRGVAHPHGHRETEHAVVKGQGTVEIGDFKVDMANAGFGMNGIHAR